VDDFLATMCSTA